MLAYHSPIHSFIHKIRYWGCHKSDDMFGSWEEGTMEKDTTYTQVFFFYSDLIPRILFSRLLWCSQSAGMWMIHLSPPAQRYCRSYTTFLTSDELSGSYCLLWAHCSPLACSQSPSPEPGIASLFWAALDQLILLYSEEGNDFVLQIPHRVR